MAGCLGVWEKRCTVFQQAQDGFFIDDSLLWEFSIAPHRVWVINT